MKSVPEKENPTGRRKSSGKQKNLNLYGGLASLNSRATPERRGSLVAGLVVAGGRAMPKNHRRCREWQPERNQLWPPIQLLPLIGYANENGVTPHDTSCRQAKTRNWSFDGLTDPTRGWERRKGRGETGEEEREMRKERGGIETGREGDGPLLIRRRNTSPGCSCRPETARDRGSRKGVFVCRILPEIAAIWEIANQTKSNSIEGRGVPDNVYRGRSEIELNFRVGSTREKIRMGKDQDVLVRIIPSSKFACLSTNRTDRLKEILQT